MIIVRLEMSNQFLQAIFSGNDPVLKSATGRQKSGHTYKMIEGLFLSVGSGAELNVEQWSKASLSSKWHPDHLEAGGWSTLKGQ